MQINRHNYEAFFLLYVDNELSLPERKAVELFVQENADLKEELHLLQQTVFNADDILFENKSSLLKEEITALQQNLLLYIDDELSTADKLNTKKLLEGDAAAKNELGLLQKTKLQPDTAIVFANKKVLYRKESGKVVGLPWRRIAAAAILLGFGTWATISFIKTNKPGETAVATKTEMKSTAPNKITVPDEAKNTLPAIAEQQQKNTDSVNKVATNTAEANTIKESPQKNNTVYKTGLPQQKDNDIIVAKEDNKKPSNNLPKPVYEIINKPESNKSDVATVLQTDKATDKINSGNKIAVDELNKTITNEVADTYALNTKFTESNAEENNDDKILYMDEDKVKKTKLGGFFRKVKRVVERTANIKTGNGIKVAGFDIK
jgi:cytoskeletal protein RodZ